MNPRIRSKCSGGSLTSKAHGAEQVHGELCRDIELLFRLLQGQEASQNRGGWRSLSVTGGWVDQAITAKIDAALKSCPDEAD